MRGFQLSKLAMLSLEAAVAGLHAAKVNDRPLKIQIHLVESALEMVKSANRNAESRRHEVGMLQVAR
jgi:hypothetical protein